MVTFCCLCGRGHLVNDVITNNVPFYINFEGERKEITREFVICYDCIEKYFGRKYENYTRR